MQCASIGSKRIYAFMFVMMQCLSKSHSGQSSLHILKVPNGRPRGAKMLCDYISYTLQYMYTVSPDHMFVSSLSAEGPFFTVEHMAG
jgi:hypothetical protein